jgi:hypothetical protein
MLKPTPGPSSYAQEEKLVIPFDNQPPVVFLGLGKLTLIGHDQKRLLCRGCWPIALFDEVLSIDANSIVIEVEMFDGGNDLRSSVNVRYRNKEI